MIISTSETPLMEARASPRKPMVRMCKRSEALASLDVACRRKARGMSSFSMPQPLSVTRMRESPPSRISTLTESAPLSMAFSKSSFTTLSGRSTTSPAAILSMVSLLSILIILLLFMLRSCSAGLFY